MAEPAEKLSESLAQSESKRQAEPAALSEVSAVDGEALGNDASSEVASELPAATQATSAADSTPEEAGKGKRRERAEEADDDGAKRRKRGKGRPVARRDFVPDSQRRKGRKGRGKQGKELEQETPVVVPPMGSPTEDLGAGVRRLRRQRAWRLALKLIVGVFLPTALAGAYYGVVASDQYESTSMFTIQSADGGSPVALDSLLGAIPTNSAAAKDTLAVRDYILSRDMLAKLEREHGFREHYQQQDLDWWARLPQDASFEDTYEYYVDQVLVDYEPTSGVLTLKVKAFSPEDAVTFTRAVLSYSEEMVNQLSERAREDQTQYALRELKAAEDRLSQARRKVLRLQGERSEFSPEQSAQESLSVRGQLKGELARVRAELSQARSYMSPTAPKVIALEQQASSLAAQIANESRRLVNPAGERGLNESIAQFEDAILEKEFAQSAYHSALTSLELARSDASRQHRYLATIASPSTPDDASYPKRLLGTLTAFILSLALVGISSLLLAAVREHARI